MKYSRILLLFSVFCFFLNTVLTTYFFNKGECILNEGIAFGFSIQYIVGISISLLLLLFLLARKVENILRSAMLGIVMLGGSNLLTRLFIKGVCDYISIFKVSFNIADIGIVILCLFSLLFILSGENCKKEIV
jgi:lipoprotein signal peptidase